MNRKTFIQNSLAAGAGSMFLPGLRGYAKTASQPHMTSNDQIRIGAIGINGMGWSNITKALEVPGVKLVALCDVDQNVVQKG